MSTDESETLTSLAKNLIALEQQRQGPSPTDEQRVLERLVQTNAFQPATAAASVGHFGTKAVVTKTLFSAAVGALVGGTAVGAWFSGRLQEAREEVTQLRAALTEPKQEKVPSVVRTEPAQPPTPPAPSLPTVSRKPHAVEAPKPMAKSDSLSEEAALIEQARTALLKNDLPAALAALTQHHATFPSGRMVEERDVMMIQVLLGQGRDAQARAAADRFRHEHPSSLLRPTLDALFEQAP
ncbi:MAG: hypothetical protein K1X64_02945 [Myxococcaceae bacterium]|nr:hypothetical protein [Myxococcaceae bacterium]